MVFCEHCGGTVAPGFKFCENCGAPVASPLHTPPPPIPQPPQVPTYQQPAAPPSVRPGSHPPYSWQTRIIIIIGFGIVFSIVGATQAGFGGFVAGFIGGMVMAVFGLI